MDFTNDQLLRMDLFHFDEDRPNFNDLAHENGFTYWYARSYMQILGYGSFPSFQNAINRAIGTCMTLGIDIQENFEKITRTVGGESVQDFKLSRFACYLIAMNADGKKPKVAQAQAFFAVAAETIRRFVRNPDAVERVRIRDEVSVHEKTMVGVAHQAGVEEFALFQNAGYRGLYNMSLNRLKDYKGLEQKKRSLLDFMGKDELAANLFRITQTELKLKNEGIKGQVQAEKVAEDAGKEVRATMLRIGGVKPEDMALEEDIKKVKTSLKQTHEGLKKLDLKE